MKISYLLNIALIVCIVIISDSKTKLIKKLEYDLDIETRNHSTDIKYFLEREKANDQLLEELRNQITYCKAVVRSQK